MYIDIDKNNRLGKEIERRRTELSLSYRELSKRSNVADSTIKAIEDGYKEKVQLPTLIKISKGLGCTVNDLLEKWFVKTLTK